MRGAALSVRTEQTRGGQQAWHAAGAPRPTCQPALPAARGPLTRTGSTNMKTQAMPTVTHSCRKTMLKTFRTNCLRICWSAQAARHKVGVGEWGVWGPGSRGRTSSTACLTWRKQGERAPRQGGPRLASLRAPRPPGSARCQPRSLCWPPRSPARTSRGCRRLLRLQVVPVKPGGGLGGLLRPHGQLCRRRHGAVGGGAGGRARRRRGRCVAVPLRRRRAICLVPLGRVALQRRATSLVALGRVPLRRRVACKQRAAGAKRAELRAMEDELLLGGLGPELLLRTLCIGLPHCCRRQRSRSSGDACLRWHPLPAGHSAQPVGPSGG